MQPSTRSTSKLVLTVNRSLRSTQHLFDYESFISQEIHALSSSSVIYHRVHPSSLSNIQHLNPQDLNLGKNLRIVNLEQIQRGDVPGLQQQPIMSLRMLPSQKFVLNRFQQASTEGDDLYLSLRKGIGQSKGHPIHSGDIIKFGKITFKILESSLGIPTQNTQNRRSFIENVDTSHDSFNQISHEAIQGRSCRICLSDEQQKEDPLLSPCNCKGSCQYVHLTCLKEWLNNKVMQEDNGFVKIINLNKFECQICKKHLPTSLRIKKQQQSSTEERIQAGSLQCESLLISLLNFQKPKGPYLILDRIGSGANQMLYCLDFTQTSQIKVGRNLTSALRLSDITVSRSHASILFSKQQGFLLKDQQSKFGTLIKIDDEIAISSETMIQRGQKVFTFSKQRQMHPNAMVYMM